ncbi:leucine-rich repeat domain-containing protein [Candidatus Poribacteria bacterium]|nr:leucine-rich repeat domain-containing protein [Candidatus Poribacteria bacterium]
MKTCKGPLLAILLLCVHVIGCEKAQQIVGTAVEPPAEVVLMPDANLAAAVRETFGLTVDAPITTEALQNLKILRLTDKDRRPIKDFTGLEYAVNLTELVMLGIHPLSDVSPLANLTNLTKLKLANLPVSDVSALANLMNLTELEIAASDISDISAFANLTNLAELRLWGTEVSDVSVLANLTNLTELRLESSQISDIAPLVANTGLGSGDIVDLRDNPLDEAATNTHIPALQARGVTVEW